ncbi:hypothetical protein [Georgenia yuyongxinii]|uniref:Preprotein translocase subunit SecB n=1 Tax=Georgenia yuyongxinii TaxID=2589797 RepID=A0A552WXZ0_9MICO|nr:hypothetical protein [Georgenia yuyongxinii]TRW47536.1 hypothetical protein FJ693_00015 [Georgenia yuyongxinii]
MADEAPKEPRLVETLEELVQLTELVGITVYEQSAKRVENQVDEDEESAPRIEVLVRALEDGIEPRFKLVFEGPGFVLTTDLALHYQDREQITIDERVVPEFLNDVAFMSAYPFLREGIMTSAARLGVQPPLLGLVRRGEIEFTQGPSSDDNTGEPATK